MGRKKKEPEIRRCVACNGQLSMYNKNKYDLCWVCLRKAQLQAGPEIPKALMQVIAKDLHKSTVATASRGATLGG